MLRLNRVCLASAMGAALLASSVMAQPPAGSDQGEGDRPGRGRAAEEGRRGGPPDGEGRGRPGGPGGFRGGPGGPGGPGGFRGGPGGPPPEMMMRIMPVLAALDADGDGKISKSEIENATVALKKLDKNNDGELTADEMRPDFSAMRGGPGGPGGPARRGRPPQEDGDNADAPERGRGAASPERGRGARPDAPDGAGRGRPDPAQFGGRMFAERDANKDGKLSGDEIPEQMSARLERVDTDGDGTVSRAEFESILQRMRSGQRRPDQGARGGDRDGQPGGERPRRPDAE